ncbi:peptidase inhibitor family I36 protein [Streptomyces sp. NBC_01477]|uniref:peptidase inhibitor family I36 protein n=1 Tax=Streptomyces sp. NBC_01477 TaxID=2976015 RepID=UPI002E349322|nr:peptidase inhibitor family I36 protein [Streptomyces sp. NBC_01477]
MRVSTFGRSVAAIATAGAALAAVLVHPAAAAGAYECSDEQICLYSSHGGAGEPYSTGSAVPDLAGIFQDKARSVFNRTSDDWCLYRDENYRGEWKLVTTDQGENLLAPLDRSVSSLRPEPDAGCGAPGDEIY